MPDRSGALLAAALSYVARGWRVMPLHTGLVGSCSCGQARCVEKKSEGKHPRHTGWQDVASSDPAEVERWWTRWPSANVGVLARGSGLVVVDVDPRNGGDESLAALEAAYGPLPSTLTAETGGGGWHYLFRHPGHELGRSLARRGVDLQAGAQLFVAAPSLHRSGSRYRWVDETAEVAELPGWIVGKARRDKPRTTVHVASPSAGGAAPELPPPVPVPDRVPERVWEALCDARKPRQYRAYTAGMVAARAGLTPSEYVACVRSSPVGRWAQEEGPEALARQVDNAYRKVGEQGSFVGDVWAHAAAADAAVDQWVGRDGRRAYRVLWNLRRRALDMGGGKFPASVRDLAAVGPESRSVVQRTMPTLVDWGWVQVVHRSRPGQLTAEGQGVASVYRLTIPSPFRPQGHNRDSGVGLGYVSASGKRGDVAELMGHDAVRRQALGVRADTFRLLLVHGPRTVGQLRKLTGLGSSAQYDHLNRLKRFGLVVKDGERWTVVNGWRERLDVIAEETGATEAGERYRERVATERSLFRGWVAERDPARWCTGCGVGLYLAGVDRCSACVGPREADTHAEEELLDALALDLAAS